MPRKKSTNEAPKDDAGAQQDGGAATAAEPMVTILKTATAAKLSPRGGGEITYQVGRTGDTALIRISGNDSSGRFSKEWVPVSALRRALSKVPKGETLFKSSVLADAWTGRSSTNPGFGSGCLRSEGVLVSDSEKKGMLKLSAPDALDAWEKAVLAMPVPKDAEQVPLHPPKPVPFFAKKKAAEADAPEPPAEEGEALETPEPEDAA